MEQSSPILLNQNSANDRQKELPHNLEAEQQLLGALIKNNDLIDRVSQLGLKSFHFYEAFPISISSLEFDSAATDLEYFTATATFQYTNYEIRNLLDN